MRQAEEKAPPAEQRGAPEAAAPAAPALSPRYIRVSVYVTDLKDNRAVSDAEVMIGQEQLLPTPLPVEYSEDPAGLYATEALEGGSYLFRVRRKGYRSVAAKLSIPPVPEKIVGHDPPVVLEPEEIVESAGDAPQFRLLVLWQKYLREPPGKAPHPTMPKAEGVSPHTVVTHPAGVESAEPAPRP